MKKQIILEKVCTEGIGAFECYAILELNKASGRHDTILISGGIFGVMEWLRNYIWKQQKQGLDYSDANSIAKKLFNDFVKEYSKTLNFARCSTEFIKENCRDCFERVTLVDLQERLKEEYPDCTIEMRPAFDGPNSYVVTLYIDRTGENVGDLQWCRRSARRDAVDIVEEVCGKNGLFDVMVNVNYKTPEN